MQVTYDYARRVAWGRQDGDALFAAAFARLTGLPPGTSFASCDLTNATICPALEAGQPTALLIWNNVAQAVAAAPIRLSAGFPAGVASYAVYDASGAAVPAQLLPPSPVDLALRNEYYNYSSAVTNNVQWLAFQAALPPLGYSVYFLVPAPTAGDAPLTHASVVTAHLPGAGDTVLTNGVVTLTFAGASGLVASMAVAGGPSTPLTQSLYYYTSFPGTQKDNQASGAYIFRPNTSATLPVSGGAPVALVSVTGPVVSEVRQVYSAWASQVTRLWARAGAAELEYTLGPIPYADGWGKEIIARYDSGLASAATWYSDSNGRDSMQRRRDYRPGWNYTVTEPVAGEARGAPAGGRAAGGREWLWPVPGKREM